MKRKFQKLFVVRSPIKGLMNYQGYGFFAEANVYEDYSFCLSEKLANDEIKKLKKKNKEYKKKNFVIVPIKVRVA